jgi:tetratricopeptide (TPR) repeat protein
MGDAITAESLSKNGKSAYQRGAFLEAARAFEASVHAYETKNDSLNAAEMANNASVAFLQANEPESALKVVEGTAEIFSQAGDLRRQGMALGNIASALEALDRDEEAIEMYQQSADVLAQAGEDQLRASVMQSLSMLQFRSGRQLQALASMQNGLEGVNHPSPRQSFLKRLLRIPVDMATRNK